MKSIWILSSAATVLMFGQAAPARATAVTLGNYYEETTTRQAFAVPSVQTCPVSNSWCYFIFNVIPAGRQLLITNVSCNLVLRDSTNVLSNASVIHYTGTTESDRKQSFPAIRGADFPGIGTGYTVTGQTIHIVRSGERPVVDVRMKQGGMINGSCTISGKIGNPPAE